MRAPYPVRLTQVDDGTIIAEVGCKTITFPDADSALAALGRYFDKPEVAIAQFSEMFGWDLNQPAVGVVTALGYSGGGAAIGQRY